MDAVVVSERTDSAVVVHFRLDPHALLGGDDGSGTPEGVADTPFGQRQRRGVRAHLRAPIRVGAEPCGTLEFFRRAPVTTELRPDQQQLLELLASWLGQVFAHRRRHGELENMALTDSLTSLPNRRAAESWFIQELARAKHSGDRIAIALVDLDHFKLINDQHGHDAGDAVLRQVAMTMKRVLREGDWIARWGGEEFLVFLHAAGARDVLAVAERLRAAVAAHPVSTANGPVDVTSSVGVCTARGGDIDMETLLAEADRALYRAKRGGRDRIVARRVGG
jgi:diguanylate cyclase (GGDEF)-like protein